MQFYSSGAGTSFCNVVDKVVSCDAGIPYGCKFMSQLHANGLGKEEKDGPSDCAPGTHQGVLDGALGFGQTQP